MHGSSEPTTTSTTTHVEPAIPLLMKNVLSHGRGKKKVEPANRQPTIPCNKAETGRLVTSFPSPVAINKPGVTHQAAGRQVSGPCGAGASARRGPVGGGQPELLNDASPPVRFM